MYFHRDSLQTGTKTDSLTSTLSNKQAVNLQFDPNMNSHIPTRATVTSKASTLVCTL